KTPRALKNRERWLTLPPDFDPQLQKLADNAVAATAKDLATTTSSLTTAQKAGALRRFFTKNFEYSLEPPRFANAPLRTFLLEERHAHCEYFAAAFAMLLRAEGIPAR